MKCVRCLVVYVFEGSSDADVVEKWLWMIIKVFDLMKLANVDRMNNVHGFLQGKTDSWIDNIHYRYGVDLTCDKFVLQFC